MTPAQRKYKNEYALRWYYRNREKVLKRSKVYAVKSNYGLSEKDVAGLMKQQGGRCAVCQSVFKIQNLHSGSKMRDFHIDHEHSTGKVRGLLCVRCNQFVGHVENRGELLERIQEYLNG